MDFFWRIIYSLLVGLLLWLLHSKIGCYPAPLPRSEKPTREIGEILILWGVAVIVPIVRMSAISPWLNRAVSDQTLRQLVQAPLLSVPYIVLPLFVVLRLNGWRAKELGLSWKSQSRDVSIFAVVFGLASGGVAFLTGQTVVGIESHHWGELLLLVYNNAFIEEFFFRGVIQSKLERVAGQIRALLWGGILYGSAHVVFDVSVLMESGVLFVLLAVLLQTMAGWLFGIIYMKTRSLWPGVTCHYLVNWLPSILAGFFGNV